MTLHPDQLHAAFHHALVTADLEATAPAGLGISTPAALDLDLRRASRSARRRPALVAAAVVAVLGLGGGAAVVAAGRDRGERAADLALPAPIGPVVAAGLDAPGLVLLDTFDPSDVGPQHPSRMVPTAHLAIFRSSGGVVLAVADRSADGDGSLDRFPLEEVSRVDGVEVRSIAEPHRSDLSWGLAVSGWVVDDRHVRVATRGLTSAEHDAQVHLLVAATIAGTLREQVPAGFTRASVGPDENPFYGQTERSSASYRNAAGDQVGLLRYDSTIDAAILARYAWYRSGSEPTEVKGWPALRVEEGGTSVLFVARPDGLVAVRAPAGEVDRYAAAVVPLDEVGWAALRATATEPGSIHQSAASTEPP